MTGKNSPQVNCAKILTIILNSQSHDYSREPLIKSGSNRLSVKTFWFKAWNARHKCVMGRAIAKFYNAETGYFNHKMSIHDLIRGSLAERKKYPQM